MAVLCSKTVFVSDGYVKDKVCRYFYWSHGHEPGYCLVLICLEDTSKEKGIFVSNGVYTGTRLIRDIFVKKEGVTKTDSIIETVKTNVSNTNMTNILWCSLLF